MLHHRSTMNSVDSFHPFAARSLIRGTTFAESQRHKTPGTRISDAKGRELSSDRIIPARVIPARSIPARVIPDHIRARARFASFTLELSLRPLKQFLSIFKHKQLLILSPFFFYKLSPLALSLECPRLRCLAFNASVFNVCGAVFCCVLFLLQCSLMAYVLWCEGLGFVCDRFLLEELRIHLVCCYTNSALSPTRESAILHL